MLSARSKVKELEGADLCGFIFKKDSPSSGLFRVKVYNNGAAAKSGSGLFAAAVARHFPLLPLEEEGRLNDPHLRENFIERVFSYRRWKDFLASGPTLGRLVEFHTAHKLLMMAHSPEAYRSMGALVAHGKELPLPELLSRYEELFMKGLALHATTRKNTNVLQHMMGYFKKQLSPEEKAELLEVIGQYHDASGAAARAADAAQTLCPQVRPAVSAGAGLPVTTSGTTDAAESCLRRRTY